MSELVSVQVRSLFSELGIECESTADELVIERFELWNNGAGLGRPVRPTVCRYEDLEAA
ncbi:hypothetical protein OG738_23095 [Amycolatopsis sp. NBC_01488]|jgi:hypothetical protein|uniref:hypothetical protein n=1 Tax=Amycolatopsis sp. NBC_01488 TaxID=2903563 RepID=UPI002E2D6621|nr:hypothetical protein [Amycolatopsis sp. NBC_01488]